MLFRIPRHFAKPLAFLLLAWLFAACDVTTPAPTPTLVEQATRTVASTATPPPDPTTEVATATQQAPVSQTRAISTPTVRVDTTNAAPTHIFPPGTPTPTLLPTDAREELFEEVWLTINDNYLYADFKGVDWKAVHDEYKPKALAALTAPEFYRVLSEMVARLGDDHSYYIAPWQVIEEDRRINGEVNYVGIGILYHREKEAQEILVVYVIPGSPAEKAGLKRRDRITHVNGLPFSKDEEEPTGIRGPVGSKVTLTIQSPEQRPREVVIERGSINGSILPSSRRLEVDPSVGYLFIPDLWTGDMSELVEEELGILLAGGPLDGLVMDLRGNGGGLRTTLEGILGQFVIGKVGEFYSQEESYPFTISKAALYERLKNVPLVVLVDKGTVSYAEVLAGSLQAGERAQVVGVASLGNTETIYPYDFEDGSRAWVAQEGFRLTSGVNLEGRGVIPDKISDKDWTRFSERNDPQIEEALGLLKPAAKK